LRILPNAPLGHGRGGCRVAGLLRQPRAAGRREVEADQIIATRSGRSVSCGVHPCCPVNIYAGARAGELSASAKLARSLVYAPNHTTNTVQVIDPSTFQVIATYPTGRERQHVVSSWDMTTLWIDDDLGNDLVPINPVTGKPGKPVPVQDPYNLYLTARWQSCAGDGRSAASYRRP
jgi:YVTN family beta-propeller protein